MAHFTNGGLVHFSPLMEKIPEGIKQLALVKDSAKFLVRATTGWGWRSLNEWWGKRRARNFWRPFLSRDLRIMLGSFGEFNDLNALAFSEWAMQSAW
jgi:hypothetical protein